MNEEMNTDEFEGWLKHQADKHRMYPSDQLWRNINQQLHGKQHWPALTFGAILTGALVTATLIFLRPDKDLFNVPVAITAAPVAVKPVDKINNGSVAAVNVKALQPLENETVYSFNYPLKTNKHTSLIEEVLVVEETTNPAFVFPENETLALNEPITSQPALHTAPLLASSSSNARQLTVIPKALATDDAEPESVTNSTNTAIDDSQEQKTEDATASSANQTEENTSTVDKTFIRLPEVKKKRWSLELYGGSNVNYRRLTEKRPYDYHLPYNATLTANNRSVVNNVVKQRPSVGFNIGTAIAYSISDRLRIKAGVQFNYRQYTIDAFRSKLERSVLLLNNGYFYPDSVYTYSVISNEAGKSPITLNNRFFQVSAPVSVEWTVAKVNKLSFNLASSVQPTYQINTNMYQITSDYKSYVQAPGLLRRWNVNAGAEATANFLAGGLQWQVGPQLRYQMMPTQKGNYSIREHLVDYGVKVGIIKQLQ